MPLYVFNSCLKVIKKCIPITRDKHTICIPSKEKSEFVYRTFVFQSVVIWNKIIENNYIKVSITCSLINTH